MALATNARAWEPGMKDLEGAIGSGNFAAYQAQVFELEVLSPSAVIPCRAPGTGCSDASMTADANKKERQP